MQTRKTTGLNHDLTESRSWPTSPETSALPGGSFQDACWYRQLREELQVLGSATLRLRHGASPLALRGTLLAVLCVKSAEAWAGTFEHLAARRQRMLPLLNALDARYGFSTVSRPLKRDAVRAIRSGTATMLVLAFASDLFNALVAVALERDLVLRLTRRHPRLVEGPRRSSWPFPGRRSQPNEKAPPCSN
jgi:hypothetical protein